MCVGQNIPQQWHKGRMTMDTWNASSAVWSLLKMWLQVITSFPFIMISGSNKEEHFEYDQKGETDLIWFDSSVGRFFPFSINITIKDTPSSSLLCFLQIRTASDWFSWFSLLPFSFLITETLMIKSEGSSVWRYTHTRARAHADLTAVTLPMRRGSTKRRRWEWVLKVKTPQREAEVPQKRLNDITKTTQLDYERCS